MKSAVGLALLVASACASAQVPGLEKLNSVRLGLFLPSGSEARDAGKAWTSFGADFDLKSLLKLGPIENTVVLSVDYYERGGVRSLPISANYKWTALQFYGYVGAGFGFHRSGGSDSSGVGFQAGVGMPLGIGPLPTFVEAKYFQSSDANVRGLAVYVGMKF